MGGRLATYHNDVLMLLSGQVCVLKDRERRKAQSTRIHSTAKCLRPSVVLSPRPQSLLHSTQQTNSGTGQDDGYILASLNCPLNTAQIDPWECLQRTVSS